MRRRLAKLRRGLWKSAGLTGLRLAPFLAPERKRRIERRLRGGREYRRLREADVVVVSYPKSGRTWLRVLLSRYLQRRYGIPERAVLGFDNLHALDPRAPKVLFTHDNYLRDYAGAEASRRAFRDKRVVLLVRQPQDVVASSYHQWKHRTRAAKKSLNGLPPHGADISIDAFARTESAGLPRIVRFLNQWSRELSRLREVLVVRYEDLRADPEREFARVADFVDGPADRSHVQAAVACASVSRTRALEARSRRWIGRGKLVPGDPGNPDSFKVRRARVGGYRDEFEADEVERLDDYVRRHLEPTFGYGGPLPCSLSRVL